MVFVQQHFSFNHRGVHILVYLQFIAVRKRKDTAATTTNSNVLEIGMLSRHTLQFAQQGMKLLSLSRAQRAIIHV